MARCSTLLVLIGTKWLSATDGGGRRRLEDPKDFVRQEIEEGLRNPHLLVAIDNLASDQTLRVGKRLFPGSCVWVPSAGVNRRFVPTSSP